MKKLKSKVLKLLSILLVLTLVLVPFTTNVDAATSTKTSSLPIYCYSRYGGTNVQVYTKTSTSSAKQGIIIPSDYIKIIGLNTSGWAKVTYPTKQGYKTGYCLSKDLFQNINFSDQSGYLKGAKQNAYAVYKKYDVKSKLDIIAGDTSVKITGIHQNGNTQILYAKSGGGYYLGWIKGKWSLTSTKPNISTKITNLPVYCYSLYGGTNVQVYTKTSTSSAKQGIIIPSDYITILDTNTSGWAKVKYPTKQGYKTGYCLLKDLLINIKFVNQSGYLKAAQSSYKVYKKYDLKSELGTISGDAKVKITGIHQNGNTQILYTISSRKFGIGWIKGKHSLTSTKPKIPTNDTIKLSVPKYSQYDSRWKNVKLGKSPKTIGQVGCTTTCLAMSESYLTKTTIYPDKMSKKLKYTSGGALYWPSNYTLKSSNNYLSEIYNQLKKGKPVLVGAKTSKGSQHWVIVTGYNGNGINKASSYTINDPGYSKKTNLQQHFDKYTKFYKIAYRK